MKIIKKENKAVIFVNLSIYPLEAVYGAAYVLLDKAYIFLEEGPKNQIVVSIKGKEEMKEKDLKGLVGEFHNELLNCALRNKISKDNQKIREYVVARALMSLEGRKEEPRMVKKEVWQKDTLGIAIPWEEKYGKRKTKKDPHSSPY
jgi:His-Xaa-Ser system protein HxsD